MAATVRGGRRDHDVGGTPFDLGAARTAKAKRRVPELLVGTFLVAIFALGGAWFYSSSTESTGYLALRLDLERGEVVEREDLTIYRISTEAPVLGIRGTDAEMIIGKVALGDMQVGTLLTATQFADRSQIPAGHGVVGLDLAPGEFPTLSLRPGDRVRVVIMPDGNVLPGPDEITVVADDVEVVEVVDGGGRDRFISLTLPTAQADLVAAADSQDRVRLVQVPGA